MCYEFIKGPLHQPAARTPAMLRTCSGWCKFCLPMKKNTVKSSLIWCCVLTMLVEDTKAQSCQVAQTKLKELLDRTVRA